MRLWFSDLFVLVWVVYGTQLLWFGFGNAQVAIREAIVQYASDAGVIDPKDFHVVNWKLVRGGVPVFS